MSTPEPTRVPTLTEVVASPPPPAPAPAAEPPADDDAAREAVIARRVLAEVQQRIDLMLEYRLREAIAPALARASDTLIREMRIELASTLREVVGEAVARELARLRHEPDAG